MPLRQHAAIRQNLLQIVFRNPTAMIKDRPALWFTARFWKAVTVASWVMDVHANCSGAQGDVMT
jgi:hypothetical protein